MSTHAPPERRERGWPRTLVGVYCGMYAPRGASKELKGYCGYLRGAMPRKGELAAAKTPVNPRLRCPLPQNAMLVPGEWGTNRDEQTRPLWGPRVFVWV